MFRVQLLGVHRSIARVQQIRPLARYAALNGTRITSRTKRIGILSGVALCFSSYLLNREEVHLDNATEIPNAVTVDSSISPFPIGLAPSVQKNLDSGFSLLGFGVRSVTFLGFKVYGIGIYISNKDMDKAKYILINEASMLGTDKGLNELLSDPNISSQLIEKLLENGIKFVARISPVRNTDYSHLKDGLIKSILAHPKSKERRDQINSGLEQLREVFKGRKGSVPKNHLLYLEIVDNGGLSVSYGKPEDSEGVRIGTVQEPCISKTLFLQYLSGKKPLSESLRKSCVEGFLKL